MKTIKTTAGDFKTVEDAYELQTGESLVDSVIMTPEQVMDLIKAAKPAEPKAEKKPLPWGEAAIPEEEKNAHYTLQYVKAQIRGERNMANEYFEALGGKGEARASSEGTDADGGYWVPPVYYTESLYKPQQESLLFSDCNVTPTNSKTIKQNYLDTGVSVAFTDELSAATHTQPVDEQWSLDVKKLSASTSFSNELLEDAPLFYNQTSKLIGEAYKQKLNQVLFTLSTPFDGLLSSDLTSSDLSIVTLDSPTVDTTSLTFEKLMAGFDSINSEDEEGLTFYSNVSVRNVIYKMRGEDGHPVMWDARGTNVGIPKFALGVPFKTVKEMPSASSINGSSAGFLVLGNLKKSCHVFDRSGMTMKVVTEGTVNSNNLAEKDMTGIIVRKRFAFKVFVPEYNSGEKTGLVVWRVGA